MRKMRISFGLWIVASIAWVAGVGYGCVRSWPHLSLDLAHTDPGTKAAYDGAVLAHVLWYGAIAMVVPLVVLVLGRMLVRR